MIYLLLAVLCSSSIALIFKHSETNNMNRLAVTSANYFTAFMISLFFIFNQNIFKLFQGEEFSNFFLEFKEVIINNNDTVFSVSASLIWAIIIGVFTGVFFFLAFIYYQKSVRNDGVGLAGVFSKLGILLPMIFSILLWQEYPTEIQWFGIILAILSIILVNFPFGQDWKKALRISLILLFFYGGIAEFSNKIFQKYAVLDIKPLFLFFVFVTAFLISIFFTIKGRKGFTSREIMTGIMVGIPNLFSSFFLINALDQLKTAVVFPIFSAGSIVVINLGGLFIFKEKLNKKEVTSIVMTIVALILINIK